MIERLTVSEQAGLIAVVAAFAWLSVSFLGRPQPSVTFVSKAAVAITEPIPALGPIMDSIEDDDREFQEDELDLCGLPGVRLVSPPPTLSLSQITPSQSLCLSALTPAQYPLRC